MTPLTYPNALLVVLVFLTGAASGACGLWWCVKFSLRKVGESAEHVLSFAVEQIPGMHDAVVAFARRHVTADHGEPTL